MTRVGVISDEFWAVVEVPGTHLARRIVYGTLLPNPSTMMNPAFGLLERLNRVNSTYTMHDNNTAGHAFAR